MIGAGAWTGTELSRTKLMGEAGLDRLTDAEPDDGDKVFSKAVEKAHALKDQYPGKR